MSAPEVALIPVPPPPPAAITEAQHDRLRELWQRRKAGNTYRAYAAAWKHFQVWAFGEGRSALPADPQTLALYLAHLSTAQTPRGGEFAMTTISLRLAAIAHYHRESGMADPTKHPMVVGIAAGLARDRAGRPTKAKQALLTKHLRKGLRHDPKRPADFRNKALLLVGYSGAFRRSELVGIDVEHLTFDDEGRVKVLLPKSKTDQTGEGQSVWILPGGSHCPVKALKAWLEISGITSGPVFVSIDRHGNRGGRISTDLVPYIVKRFAKAAGLDPAQFAGHSLRAGHVTQAFLNETPAHLIQRQGRWRSIETVMRYNRDVDAARNNSSSHLGL